MASSRAASASTPLAFGSLRSRAPQELRRYAASLFSKRGSHCARLQLAARALRALVSLAAAFPSVAAAEGLYLHSIPIAGTTAAPDGPLRIRAFVADAPALAASIPAAVRSVGADQVEIDLAAYPELEPRAPDRYRAASFVIDFDEPVVRALQTELATRYGDSPSLEELRRFTGDSIPRKSMERGFDLASRVARSGAGDCTEHAVLLTALARAAGRPARVALGVLIARIGGEPQAFGHAWAEIHEGGRWVPVDATPIADEVEGPAYLPLSLLEDEGPGYAVALGRRLQRGWVRRLEIGGAAPPARAGDGGLSGADRSPRP